MILLVFLSFFLTDDKVDKLPNPPGTTQIAENFYADQTEITIKDWLEYELYTHLNEDSTIREHEKHRDTIIEGEWSPEVNLYPVQSLTYEQVIDFCEWRTEFVNKIKYANKPY